METPPADLGLGAEARLESPLPDDGPLRQLAQVGRQLQVFPAQVLDGPLHGEVGHPFLVQQPEGQREAALAAGLRSHIDGQRAQPLGPPATSSSHTTAPSTSSCLKW